jgi:hypothetical protein
MGEEADLLEQGTKYLKEIVPGRDVDENHHFLSLEPQVR